MKQPKGYEVTSDTGEKLTCHLKKSLYGLKQSGRNWYNTFTNYLNSLGFIRNQIDPCVYSEPLTEKDSIIIIFWVDDIVIACSDKSKIQSIKKLLNVKFKMDDRGKLKWFMGIDFGRLPDGRYHMSQHRYVESVLQKFGMSDANPASSPVESGMKLKRPSEGEVELFRKSGVNYRQAVGCLIYLMMGTRPDISWIVSKLSQFTDNPGITHLQAFKRLLRYLKGTQFRRLVFTTNAGELVGYSDADWAGDLDDRRSTTGYIFTLGKVPISWRTTKQSTVALSSCEAEYMAMAEATKEAIYLRNLCLSMNLKQKDKIVLFTDNSAALKLSENSGKQHNRTKHIDIRFHFIREQNNFVYDHVSSENNLADILTKPLTPRRYIQTLNKLQIEEVC